MRDCDLQSMLNYDSLPSHSFCQPHPTTTPNAAEGPEHQDHALAVPRTNTVPLPPPCEERPIFAAHVFRLKKSRQLVCDFEGCTHEGHSRAHGS